MSPNKSAGSNKQGRDEGAHNQGGSSGSGERGNYAARPYEDMPSVTNRDWGSRDEADEQASFGPPELGGYGDFRQGAGTSGRNSPGGSGPGSSTSGSNASGSSTPANRGQGGYGEDQGRHAQSGQSRGGSDVNPRENVARGPQGERERPSHRGRGPKGYTRSDTSIADEIYSRLTDDDGIDASEILVMVEGGQVTLTGEVPERRMKHAAEDLVDAMHGIKEIHNRIRVDRGSDSFGPPGAAVRSGQNQVGSGFSSSGRRDSPLSEGGQAREPEGDQD